MNKWKKFLIEETPHHFGGRHRVYQFPNGFGASLIPEFELINTADDEYVEMQDPEAHKSGMRPIKGKWELAVFQDGELCYTSGITEDVLRCLNDPEVDNYLGLIQRL